MASGSGSAAGISQGTDITALKTKLYDACVEEAQELPRAVFHQNSIFELQVIPNNDIQILLNVAQKLVDEKLFKAVNEGGGLGWMLRTVDEARKSVSLFLFYLRSGMNLESNLWFYV
jgi:DNA-directed RNA polymerase III subunit RPC6